MVHHSSNRVAEEVREDETYHDSINLLVELPSSSDTLLFSLRAIEERCDG